MKPLVKTPESTGKRFQCCICLGDISIRGRLSVSKHKFSEECYILGYTCVGLARETMSVLEWSKVHKNYALLDLSWLLPVEHLTRAQCSVCKEHYSSKAACLTVCVGTLIGNIIYGTSC